MKVSFDAINAAFNSKLSLDERGPILVHLIEACGAELAPLLREIAPGLDSFTDVEEANALVVKLFRYIAEHVESDAVATYLLDRVDELEAARAALATTEQPPEDPPEDLVPETDAVAEHLKTMFEKSDPGAA